MKLLHRKRLLGAHILPESTLMSRCYFSFLLSMIQYYFPKRYSQVYIVSAPKFMWLFKQFRNPTTASWALNSNNSRIQSKYFRKLIVYKIFPIHWQTSHKLNLSTNSSYNILMLRLILMSSHRTRSLHSEAMNRHDHSLQYFLYMR